MAPRSVWRGPVLVAFIIPPLFFVTIFTVLICCFCAPCCRTRPTNQGSITVVQTPMNDTGTQSYAIQQQAIYQPQHQPILYSGAPVAVVDETQQIYEPTPAYPYNNAAQLEPMAVYAAPTPDGAVLSIKSKMDFEEGDMEYLFSKKSHRDEVKNVDFDPLTAEEAKGAQNPDLCKEVPCEYRFLDSDKHTPAIAFTKPGLGLSFQLWPSALHLCKYLENNPQYLTPELYYGPNTTNTVRVIELGAGTGIVGIVAAKLSSRVQVDITDLKQCLTNLQRNIDANDIPNNNVKAKVLCWGETIAEEMREPDLILASDVVYHEELFELLIDCLLQLCTKPTTKVLISYEKRRKIENRFWKRLSKHFKTTILETIPTPSARHKKIEILSITRIN